MHRYYTVPYAKYRSESIKHMVRTRKEPGRTNDICDRNAHVVELRLYQ
jgi:hypothetical protein